MKKLILGLTAFAGLVATGAFAHASQVQPAVEVPSASFAQAGAYASIESTPAIRLNAWKTARNPVVLAHSTRAECDQGCEQSYEAWVMTCNEEYFGHPTGVQQCVWMGEQILQGCYANCFAQYQ